METETNPENIKLRVQEALDELFRERLIPFKLTAQGVNADGLGDYEVPFFDSRLHSIRFSWRDGGSVKEVVRTAVLDRTQKNWQSP